MDLDFYRDGWEDQPDPLFSEPELERELKEHVIQLAGEIGERNFQEYASLQQAMAYIENYWKDVGFEVRQQQYDIAGQAFTNLSVEIVGASRPDEVVVVGAHYDTIIGTPGADDNGSAVAGLLALSGRARACRWDRTLRFVAFANEEPPFFMSPGMGSLVYARDCQERGDRVIGMICLEMLGYFCERQPDTLGLLPESGDFIGLVGNQESEDLVRRAALAFREKVRFPLQAAAPSPNVVPYAAYSDHWSFWQCGYQALMVTDTGPLRNPHYHMASDRPGTLDYDKMTRVVFGVEGILEKLAGCFRNR
jgi:Zn-dependent M28 family amino/carboxypeptidase